MPANSSHIALQSFHLMNLEWRAHYPLAETGVLLCPFQRPGLLSSCYKVIWPSHRSLCSLFSDGDCAADSSLNCLPA